MVRLVGYKVGWDAILLEAENRMIRYRVILSLKSLCKWPVDRRLTGYSSVHVIWCGTVRSKFPAWRSGEKLVIFKGWKILRLIFWQTRKFTGDALVCYTWRHWWVCVAWKKLPPKCSGLPDKRTKNLSIFTDFSSRILRLLMSLSISRWMD